MGGENSLNKYKKSFEEFSGYIKNINSSSHSPEEIHEGYLVNYEDYKNLEYFVNNSDNDNQYAQNKSNNTNQINNFDNIIEKKKLKTENLDKAINQICDNKSFIIINQKLHSLICNQNDSEKDKNKITYKIISESTSYLLLNPGKKNAIQFKNKKNNIIDKSTMLGLKENINSNSTKNSIKDFQKQNETWKIIYRDTFNYYKSAKLIYNTLTSGEQKQIQGFLVEKYWVDEWKKYSGYNNIKTNILLKNIGDESEIKNFIILERSSNNLNYNELIKIDEFILMNEKQILEKLKTNKNYVILNKDFLENFTNNQNINLINFYLSYQNIKIKFFDNQQIFFQTNNNIISSNHIIFNTNNAIENQSIWDTNNVLSNGMNNPGLLKCLIKFIYFKRYLALCQNINAFLINKSVIYRLKKHFNLSKLYNNQDSNIKSFLEGITYQNFEEYYPNIEQLINQYNNSSFANNNNQNPNSGPIIDAHERTIFIKYYNNLPNLKYIDNFEIIDLEFALFLNQVFNNSITLFNVECIKIDNKMLFIIKNFENSIYEMATLNKGGDGLVAEYLIEILTFNNNMMPSMNNSNLQNLLKNNIDNIINSNNPHYLGNITFNLHKIKPNLNQSFPQMQSGNIKNKDNNTRIGDFSMKEPLYSKKIIPTSINNKKTKGTSQSVNHNMFGKQNQILVNIDPNDCQENNPEQRNIWNNFDNNVYDYSENNNGGINEEEGLKSNIPQFKPNSNVLNNTKHSLIKKTEKMKEEEKELYFFLTLAIKLIKGREKLVHTISKPIGNKTIYKDEYFLINKKYIQQIKSILFLKEISEKIREYWGKNEAELFFSIKEEIMKDKKLIEITKLDKQNIQNILDSKENYELIPSYANNDKSNHLLYYKNCDIINSELLGILSILDKNINKKILKVNCAFDSNNIIIEIDNQIINIANYVDEIIVQYIIFQSDKTNNIILSEIYREFIVNGYKQFIKKYYCSNLIQFSINYNQSPLEVKAHIYKLMSDGNIEYIPSEKLKIIILLYYFQENIPENQCQKVYLINPKWLECYEYKNIKKILDTKKDEIKKLGKLSYDLNSASKIIEIFNKEKFKDFDNKKDPNKDIHFGCSFDFETIINGEIAFCKKFVLINEEIFQLFHIYFGKAERTDDICYIKKPLKDDIIIIKNYILYNPQSTLNIQNLILVGNIDKNKNTFDIKHIFQYYYKKTLENEINCFIFHNTIDYINTKTLFSSKEDTDYYSPIFDNDNIIGKSYKYKQGFDYTKIFNFAIYLNHKQLLNLIYLSYNEESISNKLKNSIDKDEEFYLIKKKFFSEIKAKNDYENLKNNIAKKITSIPRNKKERYQIIASFQPNFLKNLKNDFSNTDCIQDHLSNNEIELESIINSNNPNESFMIYKDFELVDKNIKNQLMNEQIPYHIIKCSFIGNNKIIFHYPINNNNLNNQKTIFIISKFDKNKNFTNEYLLIFDQNTNYEYYFNQIKKNLNNYLQSQNFINNTAPIVVNQFTIIGNIIQLSSSSLSPPEPPEPPIPSDDIRYFPPIPLVITDIKQDFSSKPLIGLENIGATCYMNATLQCLCNLRKLVEYFKYHDKLIEKVKNDKDKVLLCSAFKRLIENIYPYELSQNYANYKKQNPSKKIIRYHEGIIAKKYYAPKNFKENISRMNPLFEGVAANDAKDLVNFLLMTLHDELNIAKPSEVSNNSGNIFQDQKNQALMFNNFVDNFKKNYRSVISDMFYALNCNITLCCYCNSKSYNYQIYFFLIFPLEEVRKYKLMNMNNNGFMVNNIINTVDIYDCFTYDQKITYMNGENAMYCNYCKQTYNSSMCTYLTTGPEILIIILNRGKGIEFNVKINFYLDLDLSNYIELKNTGCQYELFGVITHIGESGMGGHFIAYCKELWNNQWLKYNDAIVSPVNDFKSEVIDFAMPYLLFYQKKK